MIWAKEKSLARPEIEKLQEELLKKQVAYAYKNMEVYRKKMEAKGLVPEDIKDRKSVV